MIKFFGKLTGKFLDIVFLTTPCLFLMGFLHGEILRHVKAKMGYHILHHNTLATIRKNRKTFSIYNIIIDRFTDKNSLSECMPEVQKIE